MRDAADVDALVAHADFGVLEEVAAELRDAIHLIDEQLGSRNRTDEAGRRVSGEEYWTWRHKAVHAKNAKSAQLRAVKARLHALRLAGQEPGNERIAVPIWPGMTRAEFLAQAERIYDLRLGRQRGSGAQSPLRLVGEM